MSISHKAKTAIRIVQGDGLRGLAALLIAKIRIPMSAAFRWKAGIGSEAYFWDDYFRTKGLEWPDTYGLRFDAGLPLQPRPAALLPAQTEVQILDVGAGPLTYLGKQREGKHVVITAVDPLADKYDKILDKYQISPLVRTSKLAAEDLGKSFPSNCFDLVFARNCIDHAYDPELAILQMVDVVRTGRYVLLEHRPNEAESEGYSGLHQWNFSSSLEGDFLIGSRLKTVNMTKKYAESMQIACEMVDEGKDGKWLITRIQKR